MQLQRRYTMLAWSWPSGDTRNACIQYCWQASRSPLCMWRWAKFRRICK